MLTGEFDLALAPTPPIPGGLRRNSKHSNLINMGYDERSKNLKVQIRRRARAKTRTTRARGRKNKGE